MTPSSSLAELLTHLAGRGISLHADAGTLCVEDAAGEIEDADLDMLRQHKPAILSFLAEFDRATARASDAFEQIRRRIDWTDSLRLEDGRDAQPAIFSVLEEYSRLADDARTRFDAERITEVVEAAIAFASRWGIVLTSRGAA